MITQFIFYLKREDLKSCQSISTMTYLIISRIHRKKAVKLVNS